jgi:Uma2 family endonuclease
MATTTTFMTAEELEQTRLPEGLWEVIDGELIAMSPTGRLHLRPLANLFFALFGFVRPRQLGEVLMPDTGVVLSERPLVVRVPDTGFIRAERLHDVDDMGYFRVIPDLVVEIVSPSDRAGQVIAKALLWLEAGATVVWSVDPESEAVTIFKAGQAPRVLTIDDTLDGGEVLPGFALPLRELFAA